MRIAGHFIAVLALCLSWACAEAAPAVRNGAVDLTDWDPAHDGAVILDGAWFMAPGQLLPPEGIDPAAGPFAMVPGVWNGIANDGRGMGSFGVATYALRLTMPKRGDLAIKFRELNSAAEIFANGRLLTRFGAVSGDAAGEVPKPGRRVVTLPDAPQIDLVIHISNHFHWNGGAVNAPLIGDRAALEREQLAEFSMNVFVLGGLAAMAIYYVAIYARRRREAGYLLISLINVLAINRILSSTRLLYQIWPDFPHPALVYLEYAGLYALVAANLSFAWWFFRHETRRAVVVASWAIAAAAALLGLISMLWLSGTREFLIGYTGVMMAYGISVVARAWRHGREGASVMGIVGILSGALVFHDVLTNLHVIDGIDIAPIAFVTFAFGHAAMLGERVEAALAQTATDAAKLTELNQSLESQVRLRTRNLEAEVERRKEAETEALRASRAKSEFLATMSHEIRTPLNGIIGIAQLLYEDLRGQDQNARLRSLIGSAEQLQAVVSDILDFSKIEAGQLEIEPGRTALKELMEDVGQLFESQARAKGLDFRVELSQELPAEVTIDANRLRQILVNLIHNAIKFTAQGRIWLLVDVSRPDGLLKFIVSDTGTGIAIADQGRLFKPFVQIGRQLSEGRAGTGLGLSICARLAELMGGTIRLVSAAGVGSTFEVALPLNETAPPARLSGPAPAPVRGARPLKVLIVDDAEINRMILTEFVRREGHEPIPACDGREAVEAAAAEDFDLVFMDMSMPEMDGFEATQAIRGLPSPRGEVLIVAASATTHESFRQDCLAAGMNGFLPKPIKREDVARMLGELGAALA